MLVLLKTETSNGISEKRERERQGCVAWETLKIYMHLLFGQGEELEVGNNNNNNNWLFGYVASIIIIN